MGLGRSQIRLMPSQTPSLFAWAHRTLAKFSRDRLSITWHPDVGGSMAFFPIGNSVILFAQRNWNSQVSLPKQIHGFMSPFVKQIWHPNEGGSTPFFPIGQSVNLYAQRNWDPQFHKFYSFVPKTSLWVGIPFGQKHGLRT